MSTALLLAAGASALAALSVDSPSSLDQITVRMAPCEVKRSTTMFYVKSSKTLTRKGTVEVDGKPFDIYLPDSERSPYSIKPRPERAGMLSSITSTYLAVDQDHNGEISELESYYAEFPLRIGNAMYDIIAIAEDGSTVTLEPSDSKLAGAVLGQRASDFQFTTVDGKTLKLDDYKGKALVIDSWAPS